MRKCSQDQSASDTRTVVAKTIRDDRRLGLLTLLLSSRVWLHLGWRDLRIQYGRSRLGPLWSIATLSVSILGLVLAQGVLVGEINFSAAAPKLAVALWIWYFASSVINDSTLLFESERRSLLNSPIGETIFVAKLLWKHLIVFLLAAPVVILLLVLTEAFKPLALFAVILMMVVLSLSLVLPLLLLARTSMIWPDIRGVVAPSVQMLFFFSPIIWRPNPEIRISRLVVDFNPIAWVILSSQDALTASVSTTNFLPRILALVVLLIFASALLLPRLPSIKNRM